MHLNDARPDLGEVVSPKEEKERQGAYCHRERDFDEGVGMSGHMFQQCTVALTELIEAALECLLKADEGVPRSCRARLLLLIMRLRHGDSSSNISPWSAPACAR